MEYQKTPTNKQKPLKTNKNIKTQKHKTKTSQNPPENTTKRQNPQ